MKLNFEYGQYIEVDYEEKGELVTHKGIAVGVVFDYLLNHPSNEKLFLLESRSVENGKHCWIVLESIKNIREL